MSDTSVVLSVPRVLEIMRSLAGTPYEDEGVDQLQHALQTAGQAREAGADSEVVVAALLHDIGRAPGVAELFEGKPHDVAGEEFCKQHCGDRVAYLVGQHVAAKRYLVAVDDNYAQSLSPASQRSLVRQGGPFTPEEVAAFEAHPLAQDAARLRIWDDRAKVTDAETEPLSSYEDDLLAVWVPRPAAADKN